MAKQRLALSNRIESWQSLQAIYQPGVSQLRVTTPTQFDVLVSTSEHIEDTQLWLPSSMPQDKQKSGCIPGLIDREVRLRVAEATDTLENLRQQLRITSGVFNFKKVHISGTGQKANTRARTLLSRLVAKTQLLAARYQNAHKILASLDPNGDWSYYLKPLASGDIRGPGMEIDRLGEGRREVSWIWKTMANPSMSSADADSHNERDIHEGTVYL